MQILIIYVTPDMHKLHIYTLIVSILCMMRVCQNFTNLSKISVAPWYQRQIDADTLNIKTLWDTVANIHIYHCTAHGQCMLEKRQNQSQSIRERNTGSAWWQERKSYIWHYYLLAGDIAHAILYIYTRITHWLIHISAHSFCNQSWCDHMYQPVDSYICALKIDQVSLSHHQKCACLAKTAGEIIHKLFIINRKLYLFYTDWTKHSLEA